MEAKNVPQTAKEFGCGIDHVRKLIDAGELQAVNIGLGKQRSRWVIPCEEIEAFKRRRASQRPITRSRKAPPTVTRDWLSD
ncbi:helix-turn-helix domain-containing protein [Novipirellula artificiosorum]|uniref:Helix-turn-helix domain protein n=1 Tax=Novipirellula artificiosorum TaxID=2528016 RepID=A0A5C6DMD7_9BACT|nr:helix-turn-helix domain-containing protein [Novipirellula artificiosorum]TWU36019.1 Helix-turn-helix domain protein [Novipirellula artificiosorum]